MLILKRIFALTTLVSLYTSTLGQQYLDGDKRYMKLTEVSTDKTYGYEIKNPIKVGSDEKAIGAYLNSLKPLDGDRLRIGDMQFDLKDQAGLTLVVLAFEQKKDTPIIYLTSTQFEQPKALIGFSFKTVDDLPKVPVFPADSIVKVTACSQTIHSVDDFLLKEKFGENNKPTTNPTFTGGLDELKKYFLANPLTGEKVTQVVFRVAITFVVTCEGKAGNFVIASKGKGDLATYANQVLSIVNKVPQLWLPATVEGKPVDCYQILSFTAVGGKLDKVSYR